MLALAHEQGAGVLAIKPLSWGTWPKDMKKTREWWYRIRRGTGRMSSWRCALRCRKERGGRTPAVVPGSARPLDRSGKAFKPLDEAAIAKLKEMAANRDSIFIREEQQVALNHPHWTPIYPDSPHECCG